MGGPVRSHVTPESCLCKGVEMSWDSPSPLLLPRPSSAILLLPKGCRGFLKGAFTLWNSIMDSNLHCTPGKQAICLTNPGSEGGLSCWPLCFWKHCRLYQKQVNKKDQFVQKAANNWYHLGLDRNLVLSLLSNSQYFIFAFEDLKA